MKFLEVPEALQNMLESVEEEASTLNELVHFLKHDEMDYGALREDEIESLTNLGLKKIEHRALLFGIELKLALRNEGHWFGQAADKHYAIFIDVISRQALES